MYCLYTAGIALFSSFGSWAVTMKVSWEEAMATISDQKVNFIWGVDVKKGMKYLSAVQIKHKR